ncbi:thymidine kinase [Cryptosporidium ubiquitum]|uniref:Thymidine kinase n=1 Tax=Cryptosporidium ubiquitum TaxID=857276 RepID=A0A1J4MR50_9CRYT|nr:thymidine kinase [Cryptosporidium ubiquitum]OII75476.1 thymidine kinase [Cryptosporidium ubiquitum]
MAKLYFYYSAMNAGKSTLLLQSSFNYQERGMRTVLFTFADDHRFKKGSICSRIGLSENSHTYNSTTNIFDVINKEHNEKKVDCALIDESQFLTKLQVREICMVVDKLNIPVLCYGLRTDFRGELFTGSKYLLAWADKLSEIKTICHCSKKATMTLRVDKDGNPLHTGEQILIGDNSMYTSVCRKHHIICDENYCL